jgi:hypothetical protein
MSNYKVSLIDDFKNNYKDILNMINNSGNNTESNKENALLKNENNELRELAFALEKEISDCHKKVNLSKIEHLKTKFTTRNRINKGIYNSLDLSHTANLNSSKNDIQSNLNKDRFRNLVTKFKNSNSFINAIKKQAGGNEKKNDINTLAKLYFSLSDPKTDANIIFLKKFSSEINNLIKNDKNTNIKKTDDVNIPSKNDIFKKFEDTSKQLHNYILEGTGIGNKFPEFIKHYINRINLIKYLKSGNEKDWSGYFEKDLNKQEQEQLITTFKQTLQPKLKEYGIIQADSELKSKLQKSLTGDQDSIKYFLTEEGKEKWYTIYRKFHDLEVLINNKKDALLLENNIISFDPENNDNKLKLWWLGGDWKNNLYSYKDFINKLSK